MGMAAAVVAVLLLSRVIKAQLQIQIRKYSQISSNGPGEDFTLEAEYVFPSGFSRDWFVNSYANIPAEGITGLPCQLHPIFMETDGPFAQGHCCSGDNIIDLPIINILENIDRFCTEEQATRVDALITYSPGDTSHDINRYHQSTNTPIAIVSEEFYFTLQNSISDNCSNETSTLVNMSIGDANVTAIRICLMTFISLCGLLFMCGVTIVLYLTVICCGRCFKRRGSYNVQENQLHELGTVEGTRHATFRGTLTSPYEPQKREFCSAGDSSTQCSICLEEFAEGEMTSVLACSASHTFHPTCIDKWLASQSTCPVCRTIMPDTCL